MLGVHTRAYLVRPVEFGPQMLVFSLLAAQPPRFIYYVRSAPGKPFPHFPSFPNLESRPKAQLSSILHPSGPFSTKRGSFTNEMRIPRLSPPGWALSVIAVLTIIMYAPSIYNPSAFMTEFRLSNEPAARLIGKSWLYARILSTRPPYHSFSTKRVSRLIRCVGQHCALS